MMQKSQGFPFEVVAGVILAFLSYFMEWSIWGSRSQITTAVFLGLALFMVLRYIVFPFLVEKKYTEERLLELKEKLKRPSLHLEDRATILKNIIETVAFLEKWEEFVFYSKEYLPLIPKILQSLPPELREEVGPLYDNKQAQIEQGLCIALLYLERDDEAKQRLETLRMKPLDLAPETLIELESFYAGLVAESAPEEAKEIVESVLARIKSIEHKIQMMHIMAQKWLELSNPINAIQLLQQAVQTAKKTKDSLAFLKAIYTLCQAHGQAGNLEISAELFVRLKRSYLELNYPPPELLDQLQDVLKQCFDRSMLEKAIRRAEKKLLSKKSSAFPQ